MNTLRLGLLTALLTCSALAQTGLTRLGEFKVNSTTSGDQRGASVASAPDGRFVVAWSNTPDGGIYFRRYNTAGSPDGVETKVNTNPAAMPEPPSVGMDESGNFVIAWRRLDDGSGSGIAARRFASDGSPLSGEFPVPTDISRSQFTPDVAMMPDGRSRLRGPPWK